MMILPRGGLCTKSSFCEFCLSLLFCLCVVFGFACFVCFVSLFLQPGLLITLPRAVCVLGALFVWFFVPETSGKTLSQLASIYKKDPRQEKDVNPF